MLNIGWNDGHTLSGIGTGAVGIIKETDRDRRIGSKARNILLNEYEGVQITNCTIDKSNNDMAEAVKIANDNKCDVFISNHVNAGGGIGFEGFHSRMASSDDIAKGRIIYNRLVATKSCLDDRRYCSDYSYKGYDLYVLRNTSMPAFLFEIGFVDNQRCVNTVNEDEVARAYAEGIAEAYGLKKKNVTPPSQPSGEMYRVRKSWSDAKSQIGAYSVLENAKSNCPVGYFVFDSKGNVVYSNGSSTPPQKPSKPPVPSKQKVDVFYKFDNLPWVRNLEDNAGLRGVNAKNLYVYPSRGEVLFRVSRINGDYYSWVQNYKTSSGKYDFAGNGVAIDRVQMKLRGLDGYSIRYRVTLTNGQTLPWVLNDTDYAGIRGRAISNIEVEII